MSLLSELKTIIEAKGITVETGAFTNHAPDKYVVLTPIIDSFILYGDNTPEQDVEEVRVSIYDKGNYRQIKETLEREFLSAGITITDRRYIGREDNTGYHHYAIDVAKNYYF